MLVLIQEQPPQLLCCCALKHETEKRANLPNLLKGSLQFASMKFLSDFALRSSEGRQVAEADALHWAL